MENSTHRPLSRIDTDKNGIVLSCGNVSITAAAVANDADAIVEL